MAAAALRFADLAAAALRLADPSCFALQCFLFLLVPAATDLKRGMILRTVNNVDCSGMQPTDVAKLLMEAEGSISILAETPMSLGVPAEAPQLSNFVTVTVPHAAGSGAGLKIKREHGKVVVSEIKEDGDGVQKKFHSI